MYNSFFKLVITLKEVMKKILSITAISLSIFTSFSIADDDILPDELRYPCEALLCLSSGTRPSECTPSLKKFFSIWDKKPWKIPAKRFNWLSMCPVGNPVDLAFSVDTYGENPDLGASRDEMIDYMNVVANGATVCSANYLNRTHWRWVKVARTCGSKKAGHYTCYKDEKLIIDTLPQICSRYLNHKLTDGKMLETLKYTHTERDVRDGYIFGRWEDNFQSELEIYDHSIYSDSDNSNKIK